MFRQAEIYRWSKKSLCRIWYKEEIVGEVIGINLANKVVELLNEGKHDEATHLIASSVKKPGLRSFLHREIISNLERMFARWGK